MTSSEHRVLWKRLEHRLRDSLGEVGLLHDLDYWFHEPPGLDTIHLIEFTSRDQLTPDVLLACDRVISATPEWSVIFAVPDENARNLVPLIQTNGGLFTLISGGFEIKRLIYEALKKRGDDWFQYVPPPTS